MKILTVHAFIVVLVAAVVAEFTGGFIRKVAWTTAAVASVLAALMAWGQR